MMRHLSWILFAAVMLVWMACEKTTTHLPPREISPEVDEIAKKYTDVLVQSPQGWVLAYKPDQYEETIYFHLIFKNEGKIDVLAGYRGYHTLQTDITYYFEGNYIPIIVFSGENVFSELADSHNGAYKFKIYYEESSGTFEVVRSDGFDDTRFELTPANENNLALLNAQIDDILAQIAYEEEQERLAAEVRAKVKAFVEIESDFYFYNLTVDGFSAAINSFDTVAREISLTYKETSTSAPTTTTVGYTLTPEGVVLDPALAYGTVSLELLELGELLYEDPDDPNKATAIEVVSNGNVGTMGYAHVAPYIYTNTDNRLETAAQILFEYRGANNYMYTTNEAEFYSPKVLTLREQLRQVFDERTTDITATRFNLLFYFRSATSENQSLQLSSRNSTDSGNRFYALYLNLNQAKLSENILNYTLNGSISAHVVEWEQEIRAEYEEFFRQLFPEEEGVTVVPYRVGTTTRFRLVSKRDSRIWVNYIHNIATIRSITFN